jgi:hypothetical protein
MIPEKIASKGINIKQVLALEKKMIPVVFIPSKADVYR